MKTFIIGDLEVDVRAPERLQDGERVTDSFLVQARYLGQPVDFWPNQPHRGRFEEHFSFTTRDNQPFYSAEGVLLGTKRGAGFRSAFWRVVQRRVGKALQAKGAGVTIGEVSDSAIAIAAEPVNLRLLLDDASETLTDEPVREVDKLRSGTTATIDCDFDSDANDSGIQDETGGTAGVASTSRVQLRFPLAALPAGLTVTDTDIEINVDSVFNLDGGEEFGFNLYNSTGEDDPDPDTAATKYSRSASTSYLATSTTVALGLQSRDLGASGDSAVQGAVDAPDFIALSIRDVASFLSGDSIHFETIEDAGTEPAALTVVYTEGGGGGGQAPRTMHQVRMRAG